MIWCHRHRTPRTSTGPVTCGQPGRRQDPTNRLEVSPKPTPPKHKAQRILRPPEKDTPIQDPPGFRTGDVAALIRTSRALTRRPSICGVLGQWQLVCSSATSTLLLKLLPIGIDWY